LWKEFLALDVDHKGLTVAQMGDLPQLKYNAIGPQLLSVVVSDKAKKGQRITFKEFILSLAVFAPEARRETKLKFGFKAFDTDNDSALGRADLMRLVRCLTPPEGSPHCLDQKTLENVVQQIIVEADLDGDGSITYDEFVKNVDGTDFYSKLTFSF
jgi:Ca2+-binding EF-hand superfamily protein